MSATPTGRAASPTLRGARIAVTGNRKGAELATTLRRRGADVLLGPTLRGDVPAPDDAILADTRAVLDVAPRWLVATTGVGMRVWAEVADRGGLGGPLRDLASRSHCVARGQKAVGGLRTLGVDPDWVSPNNTNGDVVSWLRTRMMPGESLVVQLHGGHTTVYDQLARSAADLLTVLPYHWEMPEDPGPAQEVVRCAIAGDLDVVFFTSAGAVANLFRLAEDMGPAVLASLRAALAGSVAVASVGPVTAEAVEAEGGINTVVPRRWRTADLVRGVEAWWRRRDTVASDLGLRLQPDRCCVQVADDEIALGPREYAVLAALSRRPGVLVRTEDLVVEGWGHEAPRDTRTVKHQVARLRRKLAGSGVRIETVRGAGYRMQAS